jgi:hypothetical protein
MMQIVVGLLIAGMVLFAGWSAQREIKLYRSYLQGNKHYLISKRRRNRRLMISMILLIEAALLCAGSFLLSFASPVQSLTFWIPQLALILILIYLGMKDFRETSRDIDVIVREASEVFLKKERAD